LDRFLSLNGNGQLLIGNTPLSDTHLRFAQKIIDVQTIPEVTPQRLYQSVAFVVANQTTNFERPLAFAKKLNEIDWPEIAHAPTIVKIANDMGLTFGEDRFTPIYNFLRRFPYPYEYAKEKPHVFRMRLSRVKYIGLKSASFILFSWGIDGEYLILDVHHARQLSTLIPIKKRFYRALRLLRSKNRRITESIPSGREYTAIEDDAIAVFRKIPDLCTNGKVNGRLCSALIWGLGAARARGWDPYQRDMFEDHVPLVMTESPYAV